MKTKKLALLIALCSLSAFGQSGKLQTVQPQPLENLLRASAKPVNAVNSVPAILWGADVGTIYADLFGLDKEEGIDFSVTAEDDLLKQSQSCLNDGKTPFFRGTYDQVIIAAAAFEKAGAPLRILYQYSFSEGGDCAVMRSRYRSLREMKGKKIKIALQLYGPHMYLVAKVLTDAGIDLRDVTFVWFKELTLPKYDTKGMIVDPVSAFIADESIDIVMCISPDAATLTSGGKVGTGTEGSVKGATIAFTTKVASTHVVDTLAVRDDWFQKNKDTAFKVVHTLMRAQEGLQDMMANKGAQQAKYQQLLSKSADLLLGASTATADIEGLLGDCKLVGHQGNLTFFTGLGTPRNFTVINDEIQTALIGMGLLKSRVTVQQANWDYDKLAVGLKNVGKMQAPRYNTAQVSAAVEKAIGAESATWEQEGTLFTVEIYFDPDQKVFDVNRYAADYDEALKLAQTYSGAIVIIEGHADPTGIEKARRDPAVTPTMISVQEAKLKNLSYDRAKAVREGLLERAKAQKLTLDESQIVATSMDIKSPKYPAPKTKEQWAANRRVVFRLKNLTLESTEFTPSN